MRSSREPLDRSNAHSLEMGLCKIFNPFCLVYWLLGCWFSFFPSMIYQVLLALKATAQLGWGDTASSGSNATKLVLIKIQQFFKKINTPCTAKNVQLIFRALKKLIPTKFFSVLICFDRIFLKGSYSTINTIYLNNIIITIMV